MMSFDERPHPGSSCWIIGICSVVFDIDVGQTLQFLYPEECLSEEEQSCVAFHAFPVSGAAAVLQ